MGVIFQVYSSPELYGHHTRSIRPLASDHPLHVHELHELYYFMSGKGSFYVEGNVYDLKPGSILLFAAGESHHLHIQEEHPYERICVHFSPSFLRTADPDNILTPLITGRSWGTRNLYHSSAMNDELVRSLYKSLSARLRAEKDPKIQKLICFSHILPVLYEMKRYFDNPGETDAPSSDLISRVVVYINDHLFQELSITALSERFFISKTHLNNRFRKMTGETVGNYICIKRLIQARQAIREGAPASEAALACGFKDYSSFFRRYKAHFGEAPTRVRGRNRNNY
ncbi:MAG: AraC family transcriptional regulator [Ruminiclostridium sp.]|nr:AraC family transcriptional regulator [Ruminiclostridium sp.]